MKNLNCLLVLCLYCGFAKSQDCFGEYYNHSGFCSNTIYLWSDSTFFWEFGCEGRSNIQTGVFDIIENEIFFRTISIDSFELIFNVEWVDSLDENASQFPDKLLPGFFLVDRDNKIIKGLEVVCYNNEGEYMSVLDERTGWMYFSVNEATEFYIPELSKIFKEFVSIEIPPNPENKTILKVSLNIESSFLHYPLVKFHYYEELLKAQYQENSIIFEDEQHLLRLVKQE